MPVKNVQTIGNNMMILKMSQVDLSGKKVLIREDFNVPIEDGKITNDARIRAAIPTLKAVLEKGGLPIVMSHLGRPKPGIQNSEFSLKPVAEYLNYLMGVRVQLSESWLDGVVIQPGEIVLTENVRFLEGEEDNSPALAQKMAAQCDVFVMDAFATAHRAQASTAGVASAAKIACAGPLLTAEMEALHKIMQAPKRPLVAVIGGSKISTKMDVLFSLLKQVDVLIVGGGMANTFLAAQGFPIGRSLSEESYIPVAKRMLAEAQASQKQILLPDDVVVADEITRTAKTQVVAVKDVGEHAMIGDIGPKTLEKFATLFKQAGTIVWNGPVGVFELPPFSAGTIGIARAISEVDAFSVAGGGDTLSALEQAGDDVKMDYVSTGGGAFLEYLEGKSLPGILALER